MGPSDAFLPLILHRDTSIEREFLVCSVTPMGIMLSHMPLTFTYTRCVRIN
jgi:hypothetical protein